jgi:hypothetical protein
VLLVLGFATAYTARDVFHRVGEDDKLLAVIRGHRFVPALHERLA